MSDRLRETFFDRTPDLVLVLDADGFVRDCNDATRRCFGGAVDGRDFASLVTTPFDVWRGVFERVVETGSGTFACQIRLAEGMTRSVEFAAIGSFDDAGVILVGRDTSSRKEVEAVLERQVANLRDIIDAFAGPMLATDAAGVVTFANRQARSLVASGSDSLLGRVLVDAAFWPEDRGLTRRLEGALRAASIGEAHRFDETVLDAQGDRRLLDLTFQPLVGPTGDVTGVVVSGVDVTERERAREGTLIDDAADAERGRLDRDGRWVALDDGLAALLGVGSSPSTRLWDCAHLGDSEFVRRQFEHMRAGESAVLMFEFGSGDGVSCQVTVSPVDAAGDDFEVVATTTSADDGGVADVRSSELARMKAGLLASVSHEIRTPMNAILGFVDLLLEEEGTASSRKKLRIVRSSARQLMRLLDDVLDLSAMEASSLRIVEAPFRPARVVAHAAEAMRGRAAEKGLGLELDVDQAEGVVVMGDEARLAQVVTNLISNAIKYTDAGEVGVALTVSAVDEERQIEIVVRDTGCGIAEEDLATIFEPFERVGDAGESAQGTGLGLAIVRRVVDALKGDVSVESRPGEGSRFRVALSLPVADEPVSASASRPGAVAALDVLVVDDTEANRLLVEEILTGRGHRVVTVDCAEDALERLESERFDCVLMDVNLPGIDGLEATRRIRLRESESALESIKVIALTAHASDGDREKCLAAGMDGYLPKPIDARRLIELIEGVTGRLDGVASPQSDEGRRPDDALRIEFAEALSRVDGRRDLLERLLAIFARDGEELIGEIGRGGERASDVAHQLKSQAATVGAAGLAAALEELERDLRSDREIDVDASTLLSMFHASVAAIRAGLSGA